MHVTVSIEFPALDRLVTFLEAQSAHEVQGQVDAATAAINLATERLNRAEAELKQSIQKQGEVK